MTVARVLFFGTLLLLGPLLTHSAGCYRRESGVTAYVSLDEPYSRPVLEAFERETGIRVHPVYDTEAAKSRGLAQRILAERGRPQADVFWSSEVLQMVRLQREGVLEPYDSPSAEGIPERFRDPERHWTGFAGRFRVLAYHKPDPETASRLPPQSLLELTDARWAGEVGMGNPLFGTTTTEAAALFQILGPEAARSYYRARQENGTRILDGNSVSAEQAARGDLLVAQTDTDDAFIRIDAGRPLGMVFPDQDGIGALLVPNTAGLVRHGPRPELGRRFLDFLLRPETELLLASLPARQLPLHAGLEDRLPEEVRAQASLRMMEVDYGRLLDDYDEVEAFLRELFLP
jgi:iron(III) transport system substrate-binding protein